MWCAAALFAGELVSYWNLPHFSFSSTDAALRDRQTYDTLVRLISPFNHLATALYHVLQVHNSTTSWKLLNHLATALYHVLQHFSATSSRRSTTSYKSTTLPHLENFSTTLPRRSTTSYNTSQPPLHHAVPRPTTLLREWRFHVTV